MSKELDLEKDMQEHEEVKEIDLCERIEELQARCEELKKCINRLSQIIASINLHEGTRFLVFELVNDALKTFHVNP